jgi:hypothetical protein
LWGERERGPGQEKSFGRWSVTYLWLSERRLRRHMEEVLKGRLRKRTYLEMSIHDSTTTEVEVEEVNDDVALFPAISKKMVALSTDLSHLTCSKSEGKVWPHEAVMMSSFSFLISVYFP